jgi:hypothetical protein
MIAIVQGCLLLDRGHDYTVVRTRAYKGPIWAQEHEKLGNQNAHQHLITRVPILFSETRPQVE